MSETCIGISFVRDEFSPRSSGAGQLSEEDRKQIALQALSVNKDISSIAEQHGVSRNFVYDQKGRAERALDEEFQVDDPEDEVLFYLPVTKQWLLSLTVGLVLVCSASYRQVIELLRGLFDYPISIGTVHNYLQEATEKARHLNQRRDRQLLSEIDVTALDEIFNSSTPVLAEMDTESTYISLLTEEQRRDGDTWAIRMIEQQQKGLDPEYRIGDFGRGMRKGARQAQLDAPFNGDVFHPINELEELVNSLQKKAEKSISELDELERKMKQKKQKREGNKLSKKLACARKKEAKWVSLYDDIHTLADWFRHDILSVAGLPTGERKKLYDFMVAELKKREKQVSARIPPLRKKLARHRDELLGFSQVLDERIEKIADQFEVPRYLIRDICEMLALENRCSLKWKRRNKLMGKMKENYYELEQAVREAIKNVTRASSIVENLNSRLRRYFFLRGQIGNGYLDLLRFYLNHRQYPRSRRKERTGKSPVQLLSDSEHPHWLELLGFDRFSRN